jgi:hypothetical protein
MNGSQAESRSIEHDWGKDGRVDGHIGLRESQRMKRPCVPNIYIPLRRGLDYRALKRKFSEKENEA